MISLYVCVGYQLQSDCKTVHISVVAVGDTVARMNVCDPLKMIQGQLSSVSESEFMNNLLRTMVDCDGLSQLSCSPNLSRCLFGVNFSISVSWCLQYIVYS